MTDDTPNELERISSDFVVRLYREFSRDLRVAVVVNGEGIEGGLFVMCNDSSDRFEIATFLQAVVDTLEHGDAPDHDRLFDLDDEAGA